MHSFRKSSYSNYFGLRESGGRARTLSLRARKITIELGRTPDGRHYADESMKSFTVARVTKQKLQDRLILQSLEGVDDDFEDGSIFGHLLQKRVKAFNPNASPEASAVTSKPAIRGHFKTGQRTAPRT